MGAIELIKNTDKKDDAIMSIIDMTETKKDFKKLLKFCKSQMKDFKKFQKSDMSVYQVKKQYITNSLVVKGTICNFQPNYYSVCRENNPLEITINIMGENESDSFSIHGSSIYGGCNEAEYNEFLALLKNGYQDYNYIKEVKDE